eukprot:1130838-Prymnesium_polylepis.1
MRGDGRSHLHSLCTLPSAGTPRARTTAPRTSLRTISHGCEPISVIPRVIPRILVLHPHLRLQLHPRTRERRAPIPAHAKQALFAPRLRGGVQAAPLLQLLRDEKVVERGHTYSVV